MAPDSPLTEPFALGPLRVPNRVLLAPLAGIGNWFVRLQAKRYGAGMAFSEMVSCHAIHHRNRRTCSEMLRIDPRERSGGPVAIQLFGERPDLMRSAAAYVAAAGADAIDINMGCPVPKVRKTGAGAQLLDDHPRAVAVARAVVEGAGECGRQLPVTAKLRSGLRPGDTSGLALAHRLVAEAGVSAVAFHPRPAATGHKGVPDYALAARLVQSLPAPVVLTGGLSSEQRVRDAMALTGAAAAMLARGALGNPWLFSQLVGRRAESPTAAELLAELRWTIDRAVEHLGAQRANHFMRKLYPCFLYHLELAPDDAKPLLAALQVAPDLKAVDGLLSSVAARRNDVPGGAPERAVAALG